MVEQQTWMTLLGVAGFSLALLGYLATMKRELKAEIGGVRTELKADIADTRAELKSEITHTRVDLKADIGRLDARLVTLENRTYDISARLPPAPAGSSPPAS